MCLWCSLPLLTSERFLFLKLTYSKSKFQECELDLETLQHFRFLLSFECVQLERTQHHFVHRNGLLLGCCLTLDQLDHLLFFLEWIS